MMKKKQSSVLYSQWVSEATDPETVLWILVKELAKAYCSGTCWNLGYSYTKAFPAMSEHFSHNVSKKM